MVLNLMNTKMEVFCADPANLTCSYKPQSEWEWWQTGITYAFVSAVFSVTLDHVKQNQWPGKTWNATIGRCFPSWKVEVLRDGYNAVDGSL